MKREVHYMSPEQVEASGHHMERGSKTGTKVILLIGLGFVGFAVYAFLHGLFI